MICIKEYTDKKINNINSKVLRMLIPKILIFLNDNPNNDFDDP